MSEINPLPSRSLRQMLGEVIVLDMASRSVFLGELIEVTPQFIVLKDADAHDLRDTSTTRDSYILDARQHGISIARSEVWVRIEEVVSVSKLSAVTL